MSQERRFNPLDKESAYIQMARSFTGENYPDNKTGLKNAKAAMEAQHEKIMPPTRSREQLIRIVAQKNPIIETNEQFAAIAMEEDDYETALGTTNHLFAYGDIDYKDSLGGEAFNLSLRAHRALAEKIRENFSTRDLYLRSAGNKVFAEIEQLSIQGEFAKELEVLRGVIHMVAINGTLGEKAKQRFDPFAIAKLE